MLVTSPTRSPRTVYALPSGRFLLGAVPPDTYFADLELPPAQVRSTAGFRPADKALIVSSLQTGYIPAYTASSCTTGLIPQTIPQRTGNILTAAGKSAISFAAISGPAAPFVLIGGAIGLIFGKIFGAISAGHAHAVAAEQTALCQAVPTANQFLQQIDGAFQSGQVTPDQASALLDQVLGQYAQGVAGIIKRTGSACNAACVYQRILEAIVAKRKAVYTDQAAAAAAANAAPSSSAGAPGTTPAAASTVLGGANLLPWAAAGIALILILGGNP
jgi:hypothetical protein